MCGSDQDVYNNTVWNGNHGIAISGSSGTKAFNNTIFNVSLSGISYHDYTQPEIKNNIVYNATAPRDGDIVKWDLEGSGEATVASNLCSTSSAHCTLEGDPRFIDPSAGDFRLQADSPAIDQGEPLGSPYDTDADGFPRPNDCCYDIGAYEFGASPCP
jgi:parallel beta-helix repeat protein